MPTKLLSIASPPASGIPYTDTNSNLSGADDVQEALDNAGTKVAAIDTSNVGKVYDTNGEAYLDVWVGSQAEYDAIDPKVATVLYLIEEAVE